VVNASGAWTGGIAVLVDEQVPITPKRGQIIITEKIPMLGQTNLWSARYLVTKLKSGYEIDATEEERELDLAFALTRSAGSSYLVGSTREFVGYNKGTTIEGIRAVVRQAFATVPVLRDVHFIRAIAGLWPSTPDGRMILGEHTRGPGAFIPPRDTRGRHQLRPGNRESVGLHGLRRRSRRKARRTVPRPVRGRSRGACIMKEEKDIFICRCEEVTLR
jgi:hypothetical protein